MMSADIKVMMSAIREMCRHDECAYQRVLWEWELAVARGKLLKGPAKLDKETGGAYTTG